MKKNIPWALFVVGAIIILAAAFLFDATGPDRVDLQHQRMQIVFLGYLLILGAAFIVFKRKNEKISNSEPVKKSFLKLIIGTFAFSGLVFLISALLGMLIGGTYALNFIISNTLLLIPILMIVFFPLVKRKMR